MNLEECMSACPAILMEGALGERLKREFHITMDEHVVMGGLVYSTRAQKALEALWTEYADIAAEFQLPFMATTPTRRTNRERVDASRYNESCIAENVKFLRRVQAKQTGRFYSGALVGNYGDAYTGQNSLDYDASLKFHRWETQRFAEAGVDFIYAGLMPTLEEAAGMAQAISETGVPYIISFTIKKDGCLIDGTPISRAIEIIDEEAGKKPLCYMSNCVHPKIALEALSKPFNRTPEVKARFRGLQVNTACLSYEELDGSESLKSSDPEDLAEDMMKLNDFQSLQIFGGCCGTDGRHMRAIAQHLQTAGLTGSCL